MSEWHEIALGEIITIRHGYAFKGKHFADSGKELVLAPGNFAVGGGLKFREGRERYYTGSYPKEFLLNPGDLLVVMTDLKQEAPLLGSPAIVPYNCNLLHNQRLGLVSIKQGKEDAVDRRYLYYLLLSDKSRAQIRATETGSTVRHTAPERIYRVKVLLPAISEQRRIGQILGSIDDLIENNRRRIEILEEMAQAIYRERFVHFRYPGHEDVPLTESPLGPIPESWEVRMVEQEAELVARGIAPKYADDGERRVLNQKCIRNNRVSLSQARRQSRQVPQAKQVRYGDVLINSTGFGTLGRVALFLEK